jgi:hypothetical protein
LVISKFMLHGAGHLNEDGNRHLADFMFRSFMKHFPDSSDL